MIDQAVQDAISGYKAQLKEFLALRFVDQSLVLGFTTVIQGKFQAWLLADVEKFHHLYVEARDLKQVDVSQCKLIELLRVIWSEIHHPVVKGFQKQHADMLSALMQPVKNGKKNFKAVEMRKLNDLFGKYVKAVKAFYAGVMTDVCTKYQNPLIPQKYLQEFEIVIPPSKEEMLFIDFHSTLSYITFLCLVSLGNVTRNWAQVRLAFVEPSKSVSANHKHMKQPKTDKSVGKSHYIFPLLCYSKCVGLLPTMHEPYNHIGVIYNLLGQKFSAILWFLRSQFTRDVNIAVGRRNLISAFTRPWLEEAYDQSVHKTAALIQPTDANIYLLRIIGEYFYPSAFRKLLYTEKVESDFLGIMFSEPYHERCVKTTNVIAEHVTVLICFYEFAIQAPETAARDKFGSFVVRFITAYLSTLKKLSFPANEAEIPLKNMRLILAFVRKNREFQKLCGQKFLVSLVDAFNAFQNFDGEETKGRITDSFVEGKAPIRSRYFSEDIHFKDFTPIGCQFKDFDDTHLFESGNIHLLFGSYFCDNDQGMPEFPDHESVLPINMEVELSSSGKFALEKAIAAESSRSENILRLQAIVVLAKSIFGTRIHLDSEKEQFEVETLTVPKTQKTTTERAPRKKVKAKISEKQKPQQRKEPPQFGESRVLLSASVDTEPRKPALQVAATLPTSIEEIELMILGHAPKLTNKAQEPDRDAGLADMVLAIVSEDESRDSSTSSGAGTRGRSNDTLSKTTESSRVESTQYAEYASSFYPPSGHALQHPGQQQYMRPEDASQAAAHAATFDRAAYQNSQLGNHAGYPTTVQEQQLTQAMFMRQQQQQQQQQPPHWYMGFNAGPVPPVASPYGASMVLPNAYPAVVYPGTAQYRSLQAMPHMPGNSYGVYPQPYMMAPFPPNMPTQDSQENSALQGPGGNVMYPQYSGQ